MWLSEELFRSIVGNVMGGCHYPEEYGSANRFVMDEGWFVFWLTCQDANYVYIKILVEIV